MQKERLQFERNKKAQEDQRIILDKEEARLVEEAAKLQRERQKEAEEREVEFKRFEKEKIEEMRQ